jgi:predicted O-linked N-acetylglucosamine transferase (SPINDLY family)
MTTSSEALALAVRHHQAGNLRQAEDLYRQVLQTDPLNADAWHLLGVAEHHTGRNEAALQTIGKAIALDGRQAVFHSNLGMVYRALGRPAQALGCYDQALRLNPAYANAHNNRGIVLQDQGRLTEAAACYRKALRLRPDHAEAHSNLGTVLKAQGLVAEAIAHYQEALRLRPNYPEAHNNLGVALRQQGNAAEAVDCYRRALQLKPHYADAHRNLGNVLQLQGDLAGASACFERALALAPTDALRIKAALLLPVILESTAQMLEQRRRLEANVARLLGEQLAVDDPPNQMGGTVFELAYHGLNDRDLQAAIATLCAQATPSLKFVAPHCAPAEWPAKTRSDPLKSRVPSPLLPAASERKDPLRIGFLSRFFHNHTVGMLNAGLVRNLGRPEFHVVLFRFPGNDDDIARFIQEGADTVVTLPAHLDQARQQIAQQRLDVLYYTDIGMDPLPYFLAFARLAPVQCVTWGHPVTTGIPAIDYFISSDLFEAPGAEQHYTEQLVRLKTLSTYYYRPSLPSPAKGRRAFGLAEGHHLYGCPQSLFKFHPEFDDILSAILRRDPLGRLVLIEGKHALWKDLLLQRFARVMPDVLERVLFLPRQSGTDFLNLNTACDVLLDPLHFGGGKTSFEGLALGVPIVTLPSQFLRGRLTLGQYRKMNVLDCVVANAEDYVALAVRLGTEPDYRAAVREKILAASDALFEDGGAVREHEQFFKEAVARAARD